MNAAHTLLLTRKNVAGLLTIDECIKAVETAFKLYAQGKTQPPKILGLHVPNGGFHIKAGVMGMEKLYFAAKINANFPGNMKAYELPTIQGIIIVSDAENGQLLALMDSIEITILRTGAATAVAANYLSRPGANTVIIYGCGNQGRISLQALMTVRNIKHAFVFDVNKELAKQFADELTNELKISIKAVNNPEEYLTQTDIVVTCTSSQQAFLKPEYIKPGTFIAAVGSDNEDKQELYPELIASNKIVTDITEQCASIGELHHALQQNLMSAADVHAELGEIIAGQKPGRVSDNEIIIFDSTGTALQDVAAAAIVYEKAISKNVGMKLSFTG